MTAASDRPGLDESRGLAIGDLNGDTFPESICCNAQAGNQVWLNNGTGQFSWDGTALNPAGQSREAMLADLDDDNDLDVIVANQGANSYWQNDGTGDFGADPDVG